MGKIDRCQCLDDSLHFSMFLLCRFCSLTFSEVDAKVVYLLCLLPTPLYVRCVFEAVVIFVQV